MPEMRPNWDYNTRERQETLTTMMFFYMDFEREPKAHQNYNCNSKSR